MPNLQDARATYGATLAFVPSIDELPHLLAARGLFGCGVVIGAADTPAAEALRTWAGRHLVAVTGDAVAPVPSSAPGALRRTTWREAWSAARARVPDFALDFALLDLPPDGGDAERALAAWLDAVRPGGVVGGRGRPDAPLPEAVERLLAAHGLVGHPTLLDEERPYWLAAVPLPGAASAASAAETDAEAAADDAPIAGAELTTVRIDVPARDGARAFALRLDRTRMSQRIMLDSLAAGHLYEAETAALLAEILTPGDGFVDVGAHVGYFTLLAAALVGPAGRVVSFEPEAGNFARLREHVGLNAFAHVTALPMAAGAAEGTAEFWVNADNDGGHALWDVGMHQFNARSRRAPERRSVPVTTLDRQLAELRVPRVRAVKVDAEGCEELVLRGAEALLRRDRPDVVCEINQFALERMGSGEDRLRGYLRGLGYDVYALPPGGGLVPLADDQRVVSDAVYNLLFRHPAAA